MVTTLNYTEQLVVEHCCNCGMTFAMTADFRSQRLDDHRSFYCPAGHSQHYTGKTEEQKQRERAERLERQLANRDEDLRATRASLIATKGVLTKTKKRVANGVCPLLSAHFRRLGAAYGGPASRLCGRGPAVSIEGTEQILRATLDVIRRDGWKPDGWGLIPPYNIRRALEYVVDSSHGPGARGEVNAAARQVISEALGQPIGLISHWEGQPGRTQADVEAVLEKAIAGVGG